MSSYNNRVISSNQLNNRFSNENSHKQKNRTRDKRAESFSLVDFMFLLWNQITLSYKYYYQNKDSHLIAFCLS